MRGRSRNKGPNPLTRSYESNGPDVKVRGTAQHIADKYAQLARDAQVSGDPVSAENYLQHAEHYNRLIAAAQEQFRQQYGQRPFDEDGEEGEDEPGAMNGYGYPGPNGERGPASGEDGDMPSQPYDMRNERPDRQDRPDNRQDRPDNRQDRGGPRGDRNQRFDRNNGERFDRNTRNDRFERGDRQDRQGGQRERYPRGDQPRQDFREGNRQDNAPRQEGPRQEGPRQEGPRNEGGGWQEGPRWDGRPEAPPRAETVRPDFVRPPREDVAEVPAGNLPAFLTNPVRTPASIGDDLEGDGPKEAFGGGDIEASEGVRTPRRRVRRRPEQESQPEPVAFGSDLDKPAE
jgi:hypothetical protein